MMKEAVDYEEDEHSWRLLKKIEKEDEETDG